MKKLMLIICMLLCSCGVEHEEHMVINDKIKRNNGKCRYVLHSSIVWNGDIKIFAPCNKWEIGDTLR